MTETETGAMPWGWSDAAPSETRIDLHLHSHASGMATNWWVKGLGLGVETRESYTAPEDAYRMAERAGMHFVTLTDHETIDGALTLADRPSFLVGEEVSAAFPEDGSWVDVLVYGATRSSTEKCRRGGGTSTGSSISCGRPGWSTSWRTRSLRRGSP